MKRLPVSYVRKMGLKTCTKGKKRGRGGCGGAEVGETEMEEQRWAKTGHTRVGQDGANTGEPRRFAVGFPLLGEERAQGTPVF